MSRSPRVATGVECGSRGEGRTTWVDSVGVTVHLGSSKVSEVSITVSEVKVRLLW